MKPYYVIRYAEDTTVFYIRDTKDEALTFRRTLQSKGATKVSIQKKKGHSRISDFHKI